jgi:hypothetical protein
MELISINNPRKVGNKQLTSELKACLRLFGVEKNIIATLWSFNFKNNCVQKFYLKLIYCQLYLQFNRSLNRSKLYPSDFKCNSTSGMLNAHFSVHGFLTGDTNE